MREMSMEIKPTKLSKGTGIKITDEYQMGEQIEK